MGVTWRGGRPKVSAETRDLYRGNDGRHEVLNRDGSTVFVGTYAECVTVRDELIGAGECAEGDVEIAPWFDQSEWQYGRAA